MTTNDERRTTATTARPSTAANDWGHGEQRQGGREDGGGQRWRQRRKLTKTMRQHRGQGGQGGQQLNPETQGAGYLQGMPPTPLQLTLHP